MAGSAGFVRNEQMKVRVRPSVGGYGRKEGREDGRNRQFGEIERDPEILLLFQSGIRNLAEWERAKEREKQRRGRGKEGRDGRDNEEDEEGEEKRKERGGGKGKAEEEGKVKEREEGREERERKRERKRRKMR